MSEIKRKPFVIIGTSGSHDYLKDTTGGRRFWPVAVPVGKPLPIDNEADAALVKAFVEMTSGKWIVEPKLKDADPELEAIVRAFVDESKLKVAAPDRNALDGRADLVKYDDKVHRDEP
jgi:hypothetical protein